MPHTFTEEDFGRIAQVLGAPYRREGNTVRFALHNAVEGRKLVLEICPELQLEGGVHNLISVFAPGAFLQLHDCTGYVASQELGEVLFFGRSGGHVSGLVVEREAGCSLYANVLQRWLSADFTVLPPEILMASVVLSLTETLEGPG
ncbi:MAG: hypothetical protein N2561_09860 [Bacteroidetes bacterium]|nr:hypothetical protein [Rhodothermia bacterium]MCS7155236.1 hypothetical protein [Bacteroidota bacterium]MCX7907821.1 hypothetical protein [Bacteroidota bacterium]MDW8138640.1 hypothetical protein [Bacteroidota bacterium]MDW8284774.1 hypothetical protein [Bacteroidota bacterium]